MEQESVARQAERESNVPTPTFSTHKYANGDDETASGTEGYRNK